MSADQPVSVNIMGGLGNQMFQLATGYAYAKRYNGCFIVKRNKREPDGRPLYWDSVLHRFSKYLVDDVPGTLEQWTERGATEYTPIPSPLTRGKYLNGYFQSPKYFEDAKNDLKLLFQPSTDIMNAIEQKYGPLVSNRDRIVVVHARRTDYLRNQDIINFHGPLGVEYYKQALKVMAEKVTDPIFLLASDDPLFWTSVINECPELQTNKYYILDNENEINTMALLQQFRYFVIANSTFSWWCVWLSKEPKYVIAPSKWFGPTGPKHYEDIYMESWHRI
jgi:hypothetical protein